MPYEASEDVKLSQLVKDTAIPEGRTRVVSSSRNAFIDPATPDILNLETLKDLAEVLGEDLAVKKIQDQLIIDFRSLARGKMESYDKENETWRYDLETIESEDYADWKPELRQRKSAEEKAAELFGKLTPDQIKAAMAKAGISL